MKLAPIVLFVYKRPWHTRQTIESLQKNFLSPESELYIYSDAPSTDEAKASVDEIREYIHSLKGFKKITIVKRKNHQGLAESIINGVTNIINEYGKIIVLEDDLVTSPYFLTFMNRALEFYKNEERVWHISGWNYPIKFFFPQHKSFLWHTMNCWGWGTWKNRWKNFDKNSDKFINSFSQEDILRFNLDGEIDFWSQVIANKKGKLNTWAIFWYAKIFKNDALCLNPVQTFVENIGHDGTGENCSSLKTYKDQLNFSSSIDFPKKIAQSNKYRNKVKMCNKTLFQRLKGKFSEYFSSGSKSINL